MPKMYKVPCITPEMLGYGEWVTINSNLKYKIIMNVIHIHVTIPANATNWQNLGTIPYPPEGQLLQTIDYRSGTQSMCELTTGGVVNALNQYGGLRYAVFSYPLS